MLPRDESPCKKKKRSAPRDAPRRGVDELITWRELLLSVLRDDSADNAALSLLRTMDISPDAACAAGAEGFSARAAGDVV